MLRVWQMRLCKMESIVRRHCMSSEWTSNDTGVFTDVLHGCTVMTHRHPWSSRLYNRFPGRPMRKQLCTSGRTGTTLSFWRLPPKILTTACAQSYRNTVLVARDDVTGCCWRLGDCVPQGTSCLPR